LTLFLPDHLLKIQLIPFLEEASTEQDAMEVDEDNSEADDWEMDEDTFEDNFDEDDLCIPSILLRPWSERLDGSTRTAICRVSTETRLSRMYEYKGSP
jgi:hypothetical protein